MLRCLAYLLICCVPSVYFQDVKIVGGRMAFDGEYPFVVSLQWKTVGHFCGGNLITFKKVLTACHCMCTFRTGKPFMFLVYDIIVVAGVNNYRNPNRQEVEVKKSSRHEGCGISKRGGWVHDIGIYFLKKPFFQFYRNNLITTIPLYSDDSSIIRQKLKEMANSSIVCQSAGWGYTYVHFNEVSHDYVYQYPSEELKAINMTLVPEHKCQDMLCTESYNCFPTGDMDRRSQVCGLAAKNKDVCEGDSGGPLICMGFVFGLLSWGPGCGEYETPSMFTTIDASFHLYMENKGNHIIFHFELLAMHTFLTFHFK